ncbi:MAG: ribulokinase [Planctomycetota bacterium]
MSQEPHVIGVDFGTDSVRSIVVNAASGETVSNAALSYPRWSQGLYCDPASHRYRQHPLDHIETLEITVREALSQAPGVDADQVVAIGVDTTGSTPVAIDAAGIPLALKPEFSDNPNAMFVLWKDHTAVREAGEINEKARTWGGTDFTCYVGGIYSSEWFWSKIVHILRHDEAVRDAAWSWVEHCDWIPALLTGCTDPLTLKRSRCAAGHKAMWHASWGGWPSEDFLSKVDPLLSGLSSRLCKNTHTSDLPAGTLSSEWARRLGLHERVVVAVGAIDAHLGAVGGEIKPYYLSKVIGTSTCDMLVAPLDEMKGKLIRGICGQVDGSILPGMLGMEAGQSAFGDVYAWFRDLLLWPVKHLLAGTGRIEEDRLRSMTEELIPELSRQAREIEPGESSLIALDWLNGRRTPDADPTLRGAIAGLDLGTDAAGIFRALVEATAFGSGRIVDRFEREGVPIKGIIALGGIAKKSPFVMQVLADVLNRPIDVARSDQTVALGSAMAAATAAGVYPYMEAAQKAMGQGFERTYKPDSARVGQYRMLNDRYLRLSGFIENELR